MRVFRVLSVGILLFILIASVDAYDDGAAFGLKIGTVKNQLQGHYTSVSIIADKWNLPINKFELKIAYDTNSLSFVKVQTGDFLGRRGNWRMNYRATTIMPQGADSLNGVIRILAFYDGETANQNDSCFIPDEGEELVQLYFFVSNDRNLECDSIPIRFYWEDCRDNILYSRDESIAYISEGVMDFDSLDITEGDSFPTYGGAQSECLMMIYPGRVVAERGVEFRNGVIDIICADSIDCAGDVNLNGIRNEIGDAVAFTSYLLYGYPVFDDPTSRIELRCTDINGDGIYPDISDFVCLCRGIVGDEPGIDTTFEGELVLSEGDSIIGVLTHCEQPIGALWLKFYVPDSAVSLQLSSSLSYLDMKHEWRSDTLRIVIPSWAPRRAIPASLTEILTIQYSSQKPELIFASAAGYYGERINLAIRDVVSVEEERGTDAIPNNYTLYQNYPNPFNPTTEIRFALPTQSDWEVEILNSAGRKVRTFSGMSRAGAVGIIWDGTDMMGRTVSTGVYFYRLEAGNYSEARKMILLK